MNMTVQVLRIHLIALRDEYDGTSSTDPFNLKEINMTVKDEQLMFSRDEQLIALRDEY